MERTKSGAIELRGDFRADTIWASLDQIAALFDRDKSVISRHLRNIYNEAELDEKATVAKNATVQIARLKIPLPPLAEQKKIVARLDALSEKVRKLQALQDETERDLVALKRAILARAFAGEL